MKCPKCNSNMGRGKIYDFTDLARIRIRKYICPTCKSKVVINADTKTIINHMTVYQP